MLHNLGVDLSTAEQMPMQYALAFVSEKMGFLEKLKHERQQNTHAAPKQHQKPSLIFQLSVDIQSLRLELTNE